jgi:peptide-methionine (S)-S-oxide reductase
MKQALLAGGCFWCLEAIFGSLNGVKTVVSGYCGGHEPNPGYRQVCGGRTGHAETVRIEYDPAMLSFDTLLDVFFAIHDPTTPNRQGNDIGPQYRSAVFYLDDEQRQSASRAIARLEQQGLFPAPIVTEVAPAGEFYPAEAEHHDYYWQNRHAPYCQVVISPKIAAFRQRFPSLFDD